MVDGQGRRAGRSMSLSPKLNPLDAFIGGDSDEDADARNDKDASIVPEQRPSIINERAIVRYYSDIGRTPIIFSEEQQGTEKSNGNVADSTDEHFDVTLRLDMTTGCGGKIWPAAEVLGQYIAGTRRNAWRDKTIVELGSGTGLVGLLAAQFEGVERVYITDQIPMMQLMMDNLALNAQLQDRVAVEELNWGVPVPATVPQQPDILLLADCVYLEVAFQPLVDTMVEMCTADTEILFCYQQRRKADKRFFKLLKKHFTFADIKDDDPVRCKQYNRQGTHLYRVVRRTK